ncbi:DUF6056 family protein [Lacticaseibacillus camelliae]|nr:DUF6056 family protein [Lacticaseibacillus camelliae]
MKMKAKQPWILFLLIIGFGLLGLVLPFSGDDLMWGGQQGLHLMSTNFYNYNGRLFSNILMVGMTRYTILRVLIYGFGSVGLVYLVAAVGFNSKRVKGWQLMLTTALLMTMSQEVFAQTFGWLSGFINYIFGMIPVLLMVIWVRERRPESISKWQWLLFGGLGFVSALIVEHITLYLLLFGICAWIYLKRAHSNKASTVLAFLVGIVLGAIRMFTDPSYLAAFAGKNDQRHLALGQRIIAQIRDTYTQRMYRYVFHENGLIIALLAVGLFILIWRAPIGHNVVKMFVSTLLLGYAFLTFFSSQMFDWGNLNRSGVFNNLLAIASILFVVGVILATALYVQSPQLRTRMWFYIGSALVLSAPFAIITPYGPRCAFGSVAFLLIASLDVLRAVLEPQPRTSAVIVHGSFLLGGISLLLMLLMMTANGYYNNERVVQMRAQARQGKTELVLQRLPFDQYNWNTTPNTDWGWGYPMMLKNARLSQHKYHLVFVPFKAWPN